MDRIFQYAEDEEKWYQGTIEFTKIDKEECDIMVFNTPYGYEGVKTFSGKELSFEEFKDVCKQLGIKYDDKISNEIMNNWNNEIDIVS